MQAVFLTGLKGVFRDRVFHGILMAAVIYLMIPSISTLSMRQVTELSMTLALSLLSFILLLLAVFLGGTTLWKDMERRYTYSVLGLPVSRQNYLLGKFASLVCFVFLTAAFLGLLTVLAVVFSALEFPPFRPVQWDALVIAILFDAFKYTLLIAVAFLLSTVSTSFFLPIFGSISAFLAGSASQQVFEYIQTQQGQQLPEIIRFFAKAMYYLLPNFSAFDFKLNAIYAIPLDWGSVGLSALYFVVYVSLTIGLAIVLFERRELQ